MPRPQEGKGGAKSRPAHTQMPFIHLGSTSGCQQRRGQCVAKCMRGQTCKDGFSCCSLKTTASRRFNLEVQSEMQLPECLDVPLINISGSPLARLC